MKLRDWILRRRNAYRAVFNPMGGELPLVSKIVLADLRKIARAGGTPAMYSPQSGMVDPIATGIAIGRLEVFNRITQNIHLSDADLLLLVDNQPREE